MMAYHPNCLLSFLAITLFLAFISASSLTFGFTPIFVANLNLSAPSKPISIPGSVLITEPITNGTVGGFAHPPIYENGTLQVPFIDAYGMTSNGQSFYIHEEGIGTNAAQVTRIQIYIGGAKYKTLADSYILATVNANASKTAVAVQGFLVTNLIP